MNVDHQTDGAVQLIIANACRMARVNLGITQVKAAVEMDLDFRHYQRIEAGTVNMRLDTILTLVRYYDLDLKFNTIPEGGNDGTIRTVNTAV